MPKVLFCPKRDKQTPAAIVLPLQGRGNTWPREPRVAPAAQPWAGEFIPFGEETKDARFPAPEMNRAENGGKTFRFLFVSELPHWHKPSIISLPTKNKFRQISNLPFDRNLIVF